MIRVCKWDVRVDADWHPIGAGPVVLVASQHGAHGTIQVWTEEEVPAVDSQVRSALLTKRQWPLTSVRSWEEIS